MTLSIYTTSIDHGSKLCFSVIAESQEEAREIIKQERSGLFEQNDKPGLAERFSVAVDAAELYCVPLEKGIVAWSFDWDS